MLWGCVIDVQHGQLRKLYGPCVVWGGFGLLCSMKFLMRSNDKLAQASYAMQTSRSLDVKRQLVASFVVVTEQP